MKAIQPMLAGEYQGQKIDGWLMSEKLDGFRAIWDGTNLVSREGNIFNAPEWFKAELPAGIVLDGELFAGRGEYLTVKSTVSKQIPVDSEWSKIKFMVFDAPLVQGGFEQRHAAASNAILRSPVAETVAHRNCQNYDALENFFFKVAKGGGEGIMIRKPGSPYEFKRSKNLLKLKA